MDKENHSIESVTEDSNQPITPAAVQTGTGPISSNSLEDNISTKLSDGSAGALSPGNKPPKRRISILKYDTRALMLTGLVLLVILLLGIAGILISVKPNKNSPLQNASGVSGGYKSGSIIPVNNLPENQQLLLGQSDKINFNGQLRVSDSFVLTPMLRPNSAAPGQIYYDQTTQQPYFYNGHTFESLSPGSISRVISLQGLSGNVTLVGGQGINVNGTTISNTGVLGSAAPGQIAMFIGGQTLSGSLLSQSGGSLIDSGNFTINGQLGVNGSLNSENIYINGVAVCTVAECAAGGSGSYIDNSTTTQLANFNVQAVSSGSVAGVLEANSSGSVDILDLENGSGIKVATVGSSGSTLFQTSTDSSTAFQVQNSSGTSVLNVDTANGRVGISNSAPAYALDVGSDVNTGTLYRIGGKIVLQTAGDSSNIAVGIGTLANNTGTFNAAVGYDALDANTSGVNNSAYGANALLTNNTGMNNAAFGAAALRRSTTANFNSALGVNTLTYDTIGNGNTAVGNYALLGNTSGSENTAVGNHAGVNSGNDNINAAGNNDTFVGYQAAPSQLVQNATAIGTNAMVSESDALVLGCVSGVNSCTANTLVGIDNPSPAYTLDVGGSGNYSTGLYLNGVAVCTVNTCAAGNSSSSFIDNGTATQVANFNIQSANTGSATATLELTSGQTADLLDFANTSGAITDRIDASGNLGLGGTGSILGSRLGVTAAGNRIGETIEGQTGQTADLLDLDVAGGTVLASFNATGNLTVPSVNVSSNLQLAGTVVLQTASGAGDFFIGPTVGNTSGTGTDNVGDGVNDLVSLSTGSQNTALGWHTLTSVTTASGNTGIGFQALYSSNANNNVAIGVSALFHTSSGVGNTALGYQTGETSNQASNANTTGSFNTFIGYNAGPGVASASSLQAASAIGAYSVVDANNSIALGCVSGTNGCTSNTLVGIDNATPAYTLDVAGSARVKPLSDSTTAFQVQNAAGTSTVFGIDTTDQQVYIGNPDTYLYRQSADILRTSGQLSVNGELLDYGSYVGHGTFTQQSYANSATDFEIQNAAGTSNLFVADTLDSKIGVGLTPSSTGYSLQVGSGGITSGGDINASSGYRISGNYALLSTAGGVFVGGAGNTSATGNHNVGLGILNMNSLSSGTYNTSVGANALQSLVAANDNTALGAEALNSTTAGNNTAVGYYALQATSTGTGNTALGFNAGYGSSSSFENTTGTNNTFIGYESGISTTATQVQNATAIGTFAVVGENNAITLGCVSGANGCSTTTSVGIDNASPSGVLDIGGNTSTAAGGIYFGTDTNLYRPAPGYLKTDGIFQAANGLNTYGNSFVKYSSSTALQVLDSSGGNELKVDSQNYRVAIGQSSIAANGALTIGTNTTTAAGGIYFGTDTPLFRSAASTLQMNNLNVTSTLQDFGNTLIENTSTAAFLVENSSGANSFTVDTTDGTVNSNDHINADGGLYVNSGETINGGINTYNSATAELYVGSDSTTGRSINASGTINASGADYAEWIPWSGTQPSQGSLVSYQGSEYVVSSPFTAGFIGNDKNGNANSILVTFTGQVPVLVTGSVNVGDILVNNGDGTAKALDPGSAGLTDYLDKIGIAQQASSDTGVKSVMAAIGTSSAGASISDIQAGSASFANLNTSGMATLGNLNVTGSATIADLTVTGGLSVVDIIVSGHIITSGGQPTVAIQTAAGNGSIATVKGNDTTGTITITTGSDPTAGALAQIDFSKIYGAPPHIVLSPSDDAASIMRYYKGATTASGFQFNAHDIPSANTTYTYDYFIAQ